jgi:type VI protein secretion system component VasK
VTDLCLVRFRKIPFTCSYLPGKSRVHMVLLVALGVLLTGPETALAERHALRGAGSMAVMLALLVFVWIAVRWTTLALARQEEQQLRFEEEEPPAVQGLGLHRDGVMPIGPLQ